MPDDCALYAVDMQHSKCYKAKPYRGLFSTLDLTGVRSTLHDFHEISAIPEIIEARNNPKPSRFTRPFGFWLHCRKRFSAIDNECVTRYGSESEPVAGSHEERASTALRPE